MNIQDRIEVLSKWAQDNVKSCILPFWTSDLIVDHENGGYYGRITRDLEQKNDEPRSLVLTGRLLYALSTAYRTFRDPLYREKAHYTYLDLLKRFYDEPYGGAFTTVSATGAIMNEDKPNYCEAFWIMGMSSYALATGHDDSSGDLESDKALSLALEAFDLMERRAKRAPGVYYSNMTRDWQPAGGMGFGPKKPYTPPTSQDPIMFPHHLCQAYVQLLLALESFLELPLLRESRERYLQSLSEVKESLQDMLKFASTTLYDANLHNLKTLVDAQGNRPDPALGGLGVRQSFGHDCEISYLLLKVARLLQEDVLYQELLPKVTDVLVHVREQDFAPYGALYNGENILTHEKEPSHIWWAQAEAVTAMLYGYEVTKDERFLQAAEGEVSFIDTAFVDRKNGDWFSNILYDASGPHVVDGMHGTDKLNGGKCPFHNSQMCFEVIDFAKRMKEE